jgi:hypothetical protein
VPAVLEKIFAAAIVIACVAALLRVMLGERRRERLDAGLARWARRTRTRLDRLFTWNSVDRRAQREAEDAIRRAKGRAAGDWEGNVYRPKAFGKKKGRNIH